MWVARFKLHDDEDIYSSICLKNKVECFAIPYTNFEKKGKINLIVGMILIGEERNKKSFIDDLKKDRRIVSVERYHDFILVHAAHPVSRESRAEIKRFYNPEYIIVRPVHLTIDGWESWEVACIDRKELNKLIDAAIKYYHGKLISVQEETLHNVASLGFLPELTDKQLESLKLAYKEGYYSYPHALTIPNLAKKAKKSYSTFQEHLSKAENKLVEHFLKYR
jgi:predicted DNA binding protein